jgi:Fe-S-cluster containining protein
MRSKKARRKPASAVRRDGQGRAHLLIQRDALGAPMGLALSRPLFHEAWQNQVALGAAHTAHAFLAEGHTLAQAVGLGRSAMAGISTIADGLLARDPDRAPACRSGCSHCCHQQVGVSAPEVFAIYAHLGGSYAPADLEATVKRVRDADDRTRGMSSGERLSPDLPCPFLIDERCSIYQVRPLACRGTNSLDAEACERNLRDPEARSEFLAGQRSAPCFVEPIRAFHAVAAGMQLALDDLHGLEVSPLELTAAMRIMIDDPDTVPSRWLAGEDPFGAARGGDNSDNPRIKELSGRCDDG